MKLSQYNYDFSADLLAKYPAENRDESRMLVLHRATGEIEHKMFKDILDYFEEKDVFVFNNTKVFPARLRTLRRAYLVVRSISLPKSPLSSASLVAT